MTLLYLLDTNVVSELARPMPHACVLQALTQHKDSCAIAAATLEELAFGCARLEPGARQTFLHRWLDGLRQRLPVLPYDRTAAWWLGAERARLARLGRPAARTDAEIAAVAVCNGLTLVTRNTADFTVFEGLRVADWHAKRPARRG